MFERFRSRSRNGSELQARPAAMPAPAIRALEPRFVFDGAAAPAAAQAHSDAAAQSHGDQTDAAHAEPADKQAAAPAAASPGTETASANGRHEIVVIDRGVADLATLLAGVPASAEVILIDSGRDGFDQLADALKGRSDIDAIHILSHGSAGDLRLGTGDLTAETIQGRYAADLAVIGRALTATGDLLIYGCDFAAGATGARAAALLAQATGADVAASNDATGDPMLRGDWDLEVHDGAIETGVVVSDAAQRDWHHLLAAATITVSGDPVVKDGAGNAVTTTRASNGVNYLDVESNVVGTTAFWANAGTVGGVNVSLRATVIAIGESDDAVSFATSATGGDAAVLIRGEASTSPAANRAASVTIRWDLVRADNPSVAVFADVDLQIGDIDGIGGQPNTRESVTPSQIGLTSYTLADTTDLIVDSSNDRLRVSGTQNETASPPTSVSIVRFDWTNVSSWQVTYDLAANATTGQAAFQHDGDRSLAFTPGTAKTIPKVDLDANDSSGATGNDYRATFTEKGNAVAVVDTDPLVTNTAAMVSSATVVLTNAQAGDRLNVGALPNGITATQTTGTGTITLTLSGDADQATYQAALQAITFDNTSSDPSTTDRIVKTHVTSDGIQGTSATATVSVVAVDDAPVLDLDASAQGTGYTTSYTENGAGIAIVDSDVSVADVDNANIASARVVIANGSPGDRLSVAGTLPSNIGWTFDPATYTLALTGTATKADYQTALQQIRFLSTSDDPSSATRSIAVTVNDGALDSNAATTTVTVTAVNDAPVNGLPAAQTVNEDTDLVFSTGNANRITVSDADAGGGSLTATLSVLHGVLTVGGTANVTVSGNGTGTLTLTGKVADINAALDGTTYRAVPNYNGSDTLNLVTNDNGNTGSGGAQSDTDALAITVTAVNDAPVDGVPAAQAVDQDTNLVFSTATGNALTVSDVDAGTGAVKTTISVANGILTLGGTNDVTVTGNGTATVTVVGTVDAINAALDGTIYRANSTYRGSDRLTVTTDDQGNSGTGGPLSDTDTVALKVGTDPSAPTNAVPSAPQAATEDTPLVFSAATGNAVRVTDPDGRGLVVTLSSAMGTLTLSRLDGLSFVQGDGTADATMTFSGSAADINAALEGLRFDPAADYNGAADIRLVTRNTPSSAANFTNGGFENPATSGSTYTLVPDSSVPGWMTNASDHQIEIWKSGYENVPAYEGNQFAEINANEVAALFQTFDASAGSKISLDFAHRGREGVDTMRVVVTDLGADGVFGTADDVQLLDKTYSDGNTAWGAYHEELAQNASGNKIQFEFRSVSAAGGSQSVGNFVDGIKIQQSFEVASNIRVVIAAVPDIVADTVATDEDTGITFNALTGTNGASADNFEDPTRTVTSVTQGAHGSVSFQPDGTMTYTPAADFSGSDSFTYTVTSGGTTETATVTVTVRPVNDAPVNGLPAAQAVNEDADLVFSTGNANRITVSDVDAGNGSLTTTLSVLHGTLTVGGTANVAVSGNGTGTLTLTGTVADINAALDGTTYRGNPDYNGAETLSVVTNDNGNTGSGGSRSDADALAITIAAVNDAPVNGLPAAQSVNEDTDLVFSTGNANRITVSDVDAGNGSLTTTLSVLHGTLTVGGTANVTVSGNGTGTLTLTGTVADINAALDGTAYRGNPDYNGAETLSVVTNDNGNTGSGGSRSASDALAITIAAVNDAPVNGLPAAQSVNEDADLVFSTGNANRITVSDVDAGNGSLTTTLSVLHGTLTVGGTANVTVLGNGTGTLTLTGTVADINAALDGTAYRGTADYNGPDTLTISTNDQGNTGAGGAKADTDSLALTVRPVEDPPTNGVPAATQAIDEDTPLVFSAGAGNGISVADPDGGSLTVTLSSAQGRLTLSQTTGLTFLQGSGSGDGTMRFSGAIADINAALEGLRFDPNPDVNGPAQIALTTQDPEGATASSTIAVSIAPVADIVPDAVATDEDASIGFNAITGTNGASADSFADPTRAVTSVTQGAHGRVAFQSDGAMIYTPDADFNGTDSFTYTVTSGGTTETATVTVTVRPVNDAPVLDLGAAAAGTGYATGYTKRAPGVAIVDADVSVVDVDDAGMASAKAVVTNGRTGDTLSVAGVLPSGITANFDPATYTLTLTGTASKADYQTALRQIRFSSAERDPSTITRSIAVSVNDGRLDSNFATTTIAFTAVNDAPVNGMPADQGLAEDTPLVFSSGNGNRITVSDADAENGTITTTLSVLHGTLTLGSTTGITVANDGTGSVTLTGTVNAINAALEGTTYRSAADYNGADTLTVLTDDNGNTGSGGAQTDTDTIALTIAPVNDAPRAGILPAIGSLEGDAVANADLGRYFSDVEGATLRFTGAGLPPGLAIDPATGIVSGTIDRSASRGGIGGDYTVTVTADDGNGGVTSRTFTWRVVNPGPIARNDGVVVDAASPATGSVLADNGNGPDSDPDGDPLGVAAVNGAAANVGQPVAGSAGGRFTVLADGSYRFDPGSDFADLAVGETRTTRITYTVADGDGGVAEATVAVTVTGRNVPPAALAPGDRAAADGQTVALPLGSLFSDPDGRGLRFVATGLPPGLGIDPATGSVTGTIDRAASGTTGLADYRITIVATDPTGASMARSFTFRVTNPPPLASDDRATTVEDTPVTVDVLANDRDPDGDTLTIVATGDAAPSAGHGRVTVVDGKLAYRPDPNFNGSDTITYTIADGNGGTSTASVTVTVSPADDAPDSGTLPDQFGRDGATVSYDIASRFHDPDTDPSVIQAPTGDRLSFTAAGLPPGLSIDPATGLITGTLPSDASAASRYAVTVTATDASGASVVRSFTWTVSNAAPLAAPDTATTREGAMVLVTVTANDRDPDGDPIRLVDEPGAASAAHGSVTVDPATGLLAYTPAPGFTGRDTIVYTIADAQGVRATGILTVTVMLVNDRPVALETLPGRNAADGERVRVPLGNLIADPDGDRLAYSVTGLPPGLTVDPATGEIAGTIDRAASGPSGRTTYVVTVTATDPGGLAVSRSFAWTVTNPAPSAVDDAIATAEDTPVDIDVTANDGDPDGDPLSVVPGSMAAGHGTVTLNPDGSLHYTPDRDFNGTDRIVYTITDGNGGFATASATITVTPVNDAPTFDPASPALVDRSANDAQTVSIPAGSAFGDIDGGDRLTFTAAGLPPGLTVDPATGLISGTIASDASGRVPGGVYTIVLTATDTGGATATTRFTVTVANPAPIAADDDATLAEDGILTGSVLGNDRDPDGDALRVDPVPVAGPAHGRLDLRPDGTFTYTPDADFHGADAFTYALIDSDGGRSTATVHLTVDSVNDVPTASADPLTLPANTIGTGRIVAADRDGDALGFRLTGQPVNGTVTLAADGSYAYKPYAAFSGSDSFVVEVSDGNGGRTLVTVAITITPNPVQVPPSALVPILSPTQPFSDRPAAPPVLPSASAIAANGIVLPAVTEIDALGSVGDVILADGAVVAAVNGVASLHGTTILVDRSVMLDESDRIARLSWERFERVPVGETPWFSPRPYLGRSLGVSLTADALGFGTNDLMVEAIRRPDALAINLRNYAPGLAAVAAVRLFGLDGAPGPDWIESDGKGGFWGRPPAGTGLVRIELEIELEDGRIVRRPLSVDAETGEIRALPQARPAGDARPLGTRDPEPAARPEAPLFTTQLASLGGRAAHDLALIEKALTRDL